MTGKSEMHMAGVRKMGDVAVMLSADERFGAVANSYKF
jgi:hypothetical protein